MFPDSAYRRLPNGIAIVMLVAGLLPAQAQTPASPRRPPTVPAEYVVTPFGYFHPSCVVHLAHGDVVFKDEMAVQHKDGSFENVQACSHPQFNAKGEPAQNRSIVQNPTVNGWVVDANVSTTSTYGEITAKWRVPPAPSTNHGQTIYFFPGLEDLQHVVTILQPVLAWNKDFAAAWSIASWNCCASGTVFESKPVKVNAGDTIYGAVWHTCAPGTSACPTWNVLTQDLTSGLWTELASTSSQGQVFNWAFAGVLEVYSVSQCTDYPAGGAFSFFDLVLTTNSFALIPSPNWSVANLSSGLMPQCGYGGSLPKQVSFTY